MTSQPKKKRVLVISPAGRIYKHDHVEWYAHPFSRIKSTYFNIGDMVVYDSTLKLLDFDVAEGMVIDHLSERNLNYYKSFDYVIVRASNFIHNDMNWEQAVPILEQLDLPVYAVGVGAQAAVGGGTYQLNEPNLRFWKLISERSAVIGVRGQFSAEVLAANGIQNVEVVGCPTIFRTRKRDLHIQKPERLHKVAFSIRREVDATYAADTGRYLALQRNLLLNFARRFDVRVTIHGEPEEKAYYYHDLDAMRQAELRFLHDRWWSPECRDEMDQLYRDRLFFFLKVEDYDEFIRTQDFAVGYRVHGVLPALANGVAGLLITYDTRSGELAKTHHIPAMAVEDSEVDVQRLLQEVDFSEFNRHYPERYDIMRAALEKNGLAHRM